MSKLSYPQVHPEAGNLGSVISRKSGFIYSSVNMVSYFLCNPRWIWTLLTGISNDITRMMASKTSRVCTGHSGTADNQRELNDKTRRQNQALVLSINIETPERWKSSKTSCRIARYRATASEKNTCIYQAKLPSGVLRRRLPSRIAEGVGKSQAVYPVIIQGWECMIDEEFGWWHLRKAIWQCPHAGRWVNGCRARP